ncbi:MAG: 4-hydroxy-tetrahydrodipicolinate synthase, partial [Bacteroidetes bacterium]|nr:4-hydroxy-tetrahydrodipicolinate synthase [Bacteroidota bacterium]
MKELIGTGVALITPFTKQGIVDTASLTCIVNFQIDNGVNYLVVLGTTAESAVLSREEKQLVIDTIVSANAGRLPLALGIGGNNTKAVVDEFVAT